MGSIRGITLLICAAIAAGQTQTTDQDPVIRVSVDLVQIDAVVTDAEGKHVGDLKPEDFEIFQDGKARKITRFSYIREGTPGARGGGNPAEVNLAMAKGIRPDQVRRTLVLVADTLGLSFESTGRIRGVLTKFVDEQMQPGDLVSIMTTDGGNTVLQQFTNDKRVLHAAIGRIVWVQGRGSVSSYDNGIEQMPHTTTSPKMAELERSLERSQRIQSSRRANRYATGTLEALNYAIEGLSGLPGRKAVALFSDGLTIYDSLMVDEIGHTVELANRASVVLYTFDARGLVWLGLESGLRNDRFEEHMAVQGGLNLLARETGGIFFHETNGVSQALGTALDDMSSYYLLGYKPEEGDFAEKNGQLQFHRIEVKVKRPGAHVRSRDGYFGTPDDTKGSEGATREQLLNSALYSPFQTNGVPIQLAAFYSASAQSAPKKPGMLETSLRAQLVIDARGIRAEDAPDGKKRLTLDVLAAVWGGRDKQIARVQRTFTIEKTGEELERAVAAGLAVEIDLPDLKPGAYQLRSAVREVSSGQTGSASVFVEIPDFNQHRLALSSVLISDSDPGRTKALERGGFLGPGGPVTRVFASGAVLDYDFRIFGAHAAGNSGKPKIEIEVHLFRGPERIFTGHPITLPVAALTQPVRATGQIKLPDFLPPGDYAVELIAWDRLAGAKQEQAVQWVDFRLAPTGPAE